MCYIHMICLFTVTMQKTMENACKWDVNLQADSFSHVK